MTKQEQEKVLREIAAEKQRLDARVSADVKRAAANLADRYESDLRKLAKA
jgi:hypothetical protein